MRLIEWGKDLELGVESIDSEHRQLFSINNRLLVLIEDEEKSERACREGIKYLKSHTMEHFAHEEQYMQSINYPDYEVHKRIHDNFKNNTLPALEEELQDMRYSDSSVRHFMGVVIGWLIAHTTTGDQAIVGKSANKWIDIPQGKEIDALEQSIIQTVHDMFHIKAKVISEHYEGENYGNMVCICFVYVGKNDEKWEIVLSYEERLLLKLVGELLHTTFQKSDDMVFNIIRYASRHLMEKVRFCFPSLSQCDLVSETLLTYEQFTDKYKEAPPACSFLFATGGQGYFSFSVSASESVQGKIFSTLNEENATSEIWRCMNSGHSKKKVLIVDDSNFMRYSIVKLLEEDYEVNESHSGMSAIKKLTVNRPDLILLDYDMPVCDGRQILEMIRSDEETADIPVIFLTGRDDEESIQKVMSLKPSGYLLKMIPKEDIKKAVDGFFAQRNAVGQ